MICVVFNFKIYYTQVIFAALLGFIFLGQMPDIFSVIGYIIIIGSAIFKWWYIKEKDKKETVS